MSFTDISYLELWQPLRSKEGNHLCNFGQGLAENSTPGIYRWNLPVFPGMANKAQVANNGKYNFFCREILANMIFSCKMQQISSGS